MKKIAAIWLAILLALALTGCSFSLYQRERESRDVYLKYTASEMDESSGYAETVAAERGAAVVSVIVNTILRTSGGSASVTQVYSGVIINAEGYVLSTSDAALVSVTQNGKVYTNEVLSAYAVLPEVYGDASQYRLILVGYDSDAGLSLFRFYDRFHHYTDADNSASEAGFPVVAEFSGENAVTGMPCIGIGNSLGNALNADVSVPGRVSEIALTVMSGVVSAAQVDPDVLSPVQFGGKSYAYILTSAPLNVDMYGGALFDDSGYMIGLLAMKIGYQSSSTNESGYFKRVGAAHGVPLFCEFIDSVAENLQIPVPYTLAAVSAGEEA